MTKKNILLSGKPGCGKTTLIRKLIEELGKAKIMGFFTEEVRNKGVRTGFKIQTLDGQSGMLAEVGHKSEYKVSKYGVNIDAVEEIAADSVLRAVREAEIIVIDEIGKMELFSDLFKLAVLDALESKKTVLGTISLENSEFTKSIKDREDTMVFEVTSKNREKLITEVLKHIKG